MFQGNYLFIMEKRRRSNESEQTKVSGRFEGDSSKEEGFLAGINNFVCSFLLAFTSAAWNCFMKRNELNYRLRDHEKEKRNEQSFNDRKIMITPATGGSNRET
jgi:hypothetical protein